MSSINAGKQQVSFDWYKGNASGSIKDVSLSQPTMEDLLNIQPTPPSTYQFNTTELLPSLEQPRSLDDAPSPLPFGSSTTHNIPLPEVPSSSHSLLDAEISQDFHPEKDFIETRLSPKEPSRIRSAMYLPPLGTAYTQEFNPVTDKLKSRSPREPSRIRRHSLGSTPRFTPYVAIKHPHPVDSTVQHSGETPLKRVRIEGEWDAYRSSSSDVFDMEESERKYRIGRQADPVLSGKFYRVQREFMTKVNKPKMSTKLAPIAKGLSDSVTSIKDVIVEKGQSLLNFDSHPLRDTLNSIANDSQNKFEFRPLIEGEKIEFVWPRVSQSFKDAEELARKERTSRGIDPVLFGKWKSMNTEFKNKWGSSGFAFRRNAALPGFSFRKSIEMPTQAAKKSLIDSASALVGKASYALEDAVEFTTGMMENLGLKHPHDAEWIKLQEEKERARRINEESVLSPGLDARKFKLENQLLKTVNSLKTKSEL